MDMKNTVILLIFLLSILGLVIGVACTADENSDVGQNTDKVNLESDNPLTISHLEQNEPNFINKLLNS